MVEVDTTVGAAIGRVVVQEEVLVLLMLVLVLVLSGPLELEVRVEADLNPAAVGHRCRRDLNQGAGGRREHLFQPRTHDLLLSHCPRTTRPVQSGRGFLRRVSRPTWLAPKSSLCHHLRLI